MSSTPHIVMISDWERRGGAAIAATRLAAGLEAHGAYVTRLAAFPTEGTALTPQLFTLRRAIRSRLAPGPRERFDRSATPQVAERLRRLHAAARPDVINLHNLHGGSGAGWTPGLLTVCAEFAPVVWTMHDMWPLTARCVYNGHCLRFEHGCNAECPTANEYPALAAQRVQTAWQERHAVLNALPGLVGVAPSAWLANTARRGLWREHRVAVIANGLPLDVFRPIERNVARTALGIVTDAPLVLAGAPDLRDPRKGGPLLAAALPLLKRHFTLLMMGDGALPLPANITGQRLGFVADEAQQALAYAAADLLVHPAPQDNLPNGVAEALACGTPVAAFAVGGLPEMVKPGYNGWLSADVSPAGLAALLDRALADLQAGLDLRANCRQHAEQCYDLARQAGQYLEVFETL
jgi:glycosyltransferase involved in cell wall biosynthesis